MNIQKIRVGKLKKLKKVLIIIAVFIAVVTGSVAAGIYYVDSKIYVADKKDTGAKKESKLSAFQMLVASVGNQSGVDNIMLAGVDARKKETATRTDSIMMATIDRTNKQMKLTSFMRDMAVSIPGYDKKYKINTAFFFGGPELLMKTLNQNFNTEVQYYVTIDFKAFQALVDKFGGVDVEVKPNEVDEMNKYIKEENWGNPDFIKKPGFQHLSGQQALSYSRIRHVGNGDYERTERQRKVLSLLLQKVKSRNILALPDLINTVLPYIKTNVPSSKLLAIGISALKYAGSPMGTLRIPADKTYSDERMRGQAVLVPDLAANTALLDKFISASGKQDTKNTNNASVDKSNIQISILNSTGKAGLASKYKEKLQSFGYKVVEIGNYPYEKCATTTIQDYSRLDYGDTVIHDLKFGNVLDKQNTKSTANVVIVLGGDSIGMLNNI
jgi:polyisoprenyl-teichoic acid--peptidoglycan teichoic acid transferase